MTTKSPDGSLDAIKAGHRASTPGLPARHLPLTEPADPSNPARLKARRARASDSRWCATCPISLDPTSRAVFCPDCRTRRHSERMKQARKNRARDMPVDRETLRRMHVEARTLTNSVNVYLSARDRGTRRELLDQKVRTILEQSKMLVSSVSSLPTP